VKIVHHWAAEIRGGGGPGGGAQRDHRRFRRAVDDLIATKNPGDRHAHLWVSWAASRATIRPRQFPRLSAGGADLHALVPPARQPAGLAILHAGIRCEKPRTFSAAGISRVHQLKGGSFAIEGVCPGRAVEGRVFDH